jgi:hypothetical protein
VHERHVRRREIWRDDHRKCRAEQKGHNDARLRDGNRRAQLTTQDIGIELDTNQKHVERDAELRQQSE